MISQMIAKSNIFDKITYQRGVCMYSVCKDLLLYIRAAVEEAKRVYERFADQHCDLPRSLHALISSLYTPCSNLPAHSSDTLKISNV